MQTYEAENEGGCQPGGVSLVSVEPVVTFKSVPPSTALLWDIRKRVRAWKASHDALRGCEVTIERSGRSRRSACEVRVDVAVPGGVLTVSRRPGLRATAREALATIARRRRRPSECPHVWAAVRDALGAARRLVDAHAPQQRGMARLYVFVPRRSQTPSAVLG